MDFEVYCDESRPDVLCAKKPNATYLVLGSLWLPASERNFVKQTLHDLRDRHKVGSEFKWRKVTPSRLDFYLDVVKFFLEMGNRVRFRCIAVNQSQIKLNMYHEGDQELGFYKFYYQMLHHWILDFNQYSIFCDLKRNRDVDRLHVLQQCLSNSNLSSRIARVQAIRSKESLLLQLTDLLTGIVSSRLNNILTCGTAKHELVCALEAELGRKIKHTLCSEQKVNVFVINLDGGW